MKLMPRLLICLSVLVLFICFGVVEDAQAFEFGSRTLRLRDEGPDVAILQFRLQEIGLYHDQIDGIYGRKTQEAVRNFQMSNDLTPDGVTGPNTFNTLPESTTLPQRRQLSWEDLIFIARVIHAEARGESFRGQVAVGAVILNRLDSNLFPDSVREVILQEGQFCTLSDGQVHLYPSNTAIEAAKAAVLGYDPTYGALFFYNPRTAAKKNWVAGRPVSRKIGQHTFAY